MDGTSTRPLMTSTCCTKADPSISRSAENRQISPGDAEEDANYEYDYEVHNRRSEPILFTTSVTECENCRSELKTSVRIEPDQTVGIGSMVRVDQSKTWKFNFNTDWTDAEGGGDPSSNQQPGQDNPH